MREDLHRGTSISEKERKRVVELLTQSNLSMEKIAERLNVRISIIQEVNSQEKVRTIGRFVGDRI